MDRFDQMRVFLAVADGGSFAAQALVKGAWGVLVRTEHAVAAAGSIPGAASRISTSSTASSYIVWRWFLA